MAKKVPNDKYRINFFVNFYKPYLVNPGKLDDKFDRYLRVRNI